MSDKVRLKDSPERIFDLLIRLLWSLKASKTTIKAVVALLPKPQQRWELMEWISKQMETHNPVEGEILEQALKMSKKR